MKKSILAIMSLMVLSGCVTNQPKIVKRLDVGTSQDGNWTTSVTTNPVTNNQTVRINNDNVNVRCSVNRYNQYALEVYIIIDDVVDTTGILRLYFDGVRYDMFVSDSTSHMGVFLLHPNALTRMMTSNPNIIYYPKLFQLMRDSRKMTTEIPLWLGGTKQIIIDLAGFGFAGTNVDMLCGSS